MKGRKWVYGTTIIMTILISVSLITGGCAKPAPAESIKIGALAGLTGFMAKDAMGSLRGVELKLDEVGYEVAGRKIELITEDGASDPTIYVDKARKLVERDKVDVILGPLFSAAGFAVADYLAESRTPNVCFAQHSYGVLEFGGANVFMWAGTLLGSGYPLGLYAYDALGYRTASVIHADHVTGAEFTGGFIHAFESRGGTIVQNQASPPMELDYSAYLTTMKKADCVVFWLHTVAPFLAQYASYGLEMPLLIPSNGISSEVQMAEAGDVSIGMIGSSHYSALIDTDTNKQFVDAFYKKYGTYTRLESQGGYVAVSMFLEAVKATGGDTSHEAINNALRNLKMDAPGGTYSFTPEGLGIGDMYIQKVVKIGDRYAWEPIYNYSQIVLDEPK